MTYVKLLYQYHVSKISAIVIDCRILSFQICCFSRVIVHARDSVSYPSDHIKYKKTYYFYQIGKGLWHL